MRIEVNGESRQIEASTLADALGALGLGEAKVATALNGEFVASAERGRTPLSDGDRLEVLTAMQGG